MSFLEKRKRERGDRRDGHLVKDAPAMNIIMSALYPNRCDCEVSTRMEFDVTDLLKYIEKRNETSEVKIKFFHCFVTAVVRLLNERRRLNRFVQAGRMYERDEISVSFVAKRMMHDEAEEALVTYKGRKEHNVDDVARFILGEVKEVRKDNVKENRKDVTSTIDAFAKLPRLLLLMLTGFVRWLDLWGWVPKALTEGDPAYSSVLLANLGSIQCPSAYHHLNNYGTGSIMINNGTIQKKSVLKEDGSVEVRDIVDVTITADERIADGFYFAKSLKLLGKILATPELLEKTFDEDITL